MAGPLFFSLFFVVAANPGNDLDVAIESYVVDNFITEVVVKDLKNNESYWTQEKLNLVKPYSIPSVDPTKKHSNYHYEHVENQQTDVSCEKFV